MRAASLVFLILLCQGIGILGARWTAPEIPAWYSTLTKPSFNPPSWIFGPVWTLLYLLMAIAAWRIVHTPASTDRTAALAVFAIQLALNLLWSWIFFRHHALGAALVEVICLWLTIAVSAILFARIDSIAAWLLTPYLAWTAFASLLNGAIWRLNK
ncbi:TspO/MBR family protein [Occallatibacter riparius]|uniref:Tryptophan-rich sensory protein n=1 Tax=Occallatibacter riparius TaxID=1002689 RepID=A0A9J7BT62_9BACT|nr:TspO/MBR family protein [Occallatibacter riparius]UWZ85815.1 tryptophan-rich sensory protein [Occallatibacter riparius]